MREEGRGEMREEGRRGGDKGGGRRLKCMQTISSVHKRVQQQLLLSLSLSLSLSHASTPPLPPSVTLPDV